MQVFGEGLWLLFVILFNLKEASIMLYESDINQLLDQWKTRANCPVFSDEYRCSVSECIYDLNRLIKKTYDEEALANEAFEEQLKRDEQLWNEYLSGAYAEDGVARA